MMTLAFRAMICSTATFLMSAIFKSPEFSCKIAEGLRLTNSVTVVMQVCLLRTMLSSPNLIDLLNFLSMTGVFSVDNFWNVTRCF